MKSFSIQARNLITTYAQDEARKLGSSELLPEHVILAVLNKRTGDAYACFIRLKTNILEIKQNLLVYLNQTNNNPTLEHIRPGYRFKQMLKTADYVASELNDDEILPEHFILAELEDPSCVAFINLRKENKFTFDDYRSILFDIRSEHINSNHTDELKDSILAGISIVDKLLSDLTSEAEVDMEGNNVKTPESPAEKNDDKSRTVKKDSFLAQYSRDLTDLARLGKLDPVVGRDKEIKRIIQILSRRTKNNPVLTGEPGVGKTAIVEGLAQYIAEGKVPHDLLQKKVLSLDLTAIVAGTKYRGEFEERMKKMLAEVLEDKNIIIFIDELHSIIGAGGNEGTMDASNIMKPALSRGEIQIIGATTTKEYTKHIEKDLALERRFQVVKVEEPDDKDTELILHGIKERYEKYHHVVYDDDVIPAIVKLSKRYIPEKVLPDKAIDIMDEAGAAKKILEETKPTEIIDIENNIAELVEEKKNLVKNQKYERAAEVRDKVIDLRQKLNSYSNLMFENACVQKKHVTVADIEHIISEMTQIPVEHLTSSEAERIVRMEDELHKTVIGQDEAVNVISSAIRRSRVGLSSPKHPVGSFIFLGPTGVGKTSLAKALAKYLFGTEEALIRIDMSDFMEKHNASRLVGSPPGYVGYEDGGILTEKVRRHPYSVVLFDEIEKAHPDIFNLLLQMLEEGQLSDNLGHTVNFKNTVIIMTSNAGARQITSEGRVGFGTNEGLLSYSEIKSSAMTELKKFLSPELLNRIDDVIVFNALSKAEISKILELQLEELKTALQDRNLSISIKPKAREYLVEKGYNPAMGARPMSRLIRKEIEDPLALAILDNKDQTANTVSIEYAQDKLKVKLVKKDVKVKVLVEK